MGVRYRKKIQIFPGLYANISKSGVSYTVGKRGASINFSKSGAYGNLGIPGSGFTSRTRLSATAKARQRAIEREKKRQQKEQERLSKERQLEEVTAEVNELNLENKKLINVHKLEPVSIDTIYAARNNVFQRKNFNKEEPKASHTKVPAAIAFFVLYAILEQMIGNGIVDIVLAAIGCYGVFKYTSKDNDKVFYNSTVYQSYLEEKRLFEEQESLRELEFSKNKEELNKSYELALLRSKDKPEENFDLILESIDWPEETIVTYDIDGDKVIIDVDLPEIEDMPQCNYKVAGKLGEKRVEEVKKSDKEIRLDYALHIHGVLYMLLNTAFTHLPSINEVMVSGYTQRIIQSLGRVEDDYVLSASVLRSDWDKLQSTCSTNDFDPITQLGQLNLRRNMTQTGILRTIVPFATCEE